MYPKFEGVRDETLILKYKESRNDDVEMEIIERYKIHSRKLASELYQKYRYIYRVEYEDVFAIALGNVLLAINCFKKNFSFFNLWKRIATNEINLYVTSLPLKKNALSNFLVTSRDSDLNESTMIMASPAAEEHNILAIEIEKMLQNNKENFDKNDLDIYILYISGFSITDIAKETGLKYHYVRSRVASIKRKIEKYFVHS